MSIFSSEGDVIESFRVLLGVESGVSVVNESMIICNIPFDGYYITVMNSKGKIIKQIGEIVKYQKDEYINN